MTTVTVGGADNEATIRKALAIGADDAVRIDAQPNDAFEVAEQIAAYAKDKGFELILCGKETIDHNGAQVGGMLAELLDMPYLPVVSKLDVTGGVATLECDVRGGVEVVEVSLPCGDRLRERHGRAAHPQHARHHGGPHQTLDRGACGCC